MTLEVPLSAVAELVGREPGLSQWTEITQQRIDRFAEVTGDRQWMHVDVVRANREMGGTIAHGLHHCIGHMLAKMQVTEFFGEPVRRFAGAELLDPKLDFMTQVAFRGLYHLNARMMRRAEDAGMQALATNS